MPQIPLNRINALHNFMAMHHGRTSYRHIGRVRSPGCSLSGAQLSASSRHPVQWIRLHRTSVVFNPFDSHGSQLAPFHADHCIISSATNEIKRTRVRCRLAPIAMFWVGPTSHSFFENQRKTKKEGGSMCGTSEQATRRCTMSVFQRYWSSTPLRFSNC